MHEHETSHPALESWLAGHADSAQRVSCAAVNFYNSGDRGRTPLCGNCGVGPRTTRAQYERSDLYCPDRCVPATLGKFSATLWSSNISFPHAAGGDHHPGAGTCRLRRLALQPALTEQGMGDGCCLHYE